MTVENSTNFDIQVLRVQDLASILQIGRQKAYALMRASSFPSIKIGGTYIVTKDSLNRWLADNANKHFII